MRSLLEPAVYQDIQVEDYLYVTLTDDGELIEPMGNLRTVYPNIMVIDFEKKEDVAEAARISADKEYGINPSRIFATFIRILPVGSLSLTSYYW